MASVSAQLGCTNVQSNPPIELYAHDEKSCTFQGHDVSILTFTSMSTQQSWQAAADQFGGGYVAGDRWVVETADGPSVTSAIQAKIGGTAH